MFWHSCGKRNGFSCIFIQICWLPQSRRMSQEKDQVTLLLFFIYLLTSTPRKQLLLLLLLCLAKKSQSLSSKTLWLNFIHQCVHFSLVDTWLSEKCCRFALLSISIAAAFLRVKFSLASRAGIVFEELSQDPGTNISERSLLTLLWEERPCHWLLH